MAKGNGKSEVPNLDAERELPAAEEDGFKEKTAQAAAATVEAEDERVVTSRYRTRGQVHGQSERREPAAERIVYMALMGSAYVLVLNEPFSIGWFGKRFVPDAPWIGATGVAIAAAGIALAIWARRHLGQNWSATVTLKEGHELIRTGPYGRIRHPIYTGMLVAFAGTALALGEYRGLLGFAIATCTLFAKAKKEERYLVQEFGDRFQEHIRHTGMFLPKLT
jgi:protein-S-isoprenylcysteine O-methyltransferase Ste14